MSIVLYADVITSIRYDSARILVKSPARWIIGAASVLKAILKRIDKE